LQVGEGTGRGKNYDSVLDRNLSKSAERKIDG
jgi:hypothetical protein